MCAMISAIGSEEYQRLKNRLLFHMWVERLAQQAHSRREEAFSVYLQSEAIALSGPERRQMFAELMEMLGHDRGV